MVAAIGLISLNFIRRRLYEVFLTTHLLPSIAVIVLLWLHISLRSTYAVVCLALSTSFFLIQKFAGLIFILYQNVGAGPKCQATITRFPETSGGEEVLRVQVVLKRPWNVKPGQLVYLTLPRLGYFGPGVFGSRLFGAGLFESHPYMISWFMGEKETLAQTIVFLIRCDRGFSKRLRLADKVGPAIIDGPYGGHMLRVLGDYDKVLFIASGIGITSHLLSLRHLLVAHNHQTARVRRLSLMWFLDTKDQFCWAEEFLLALHEMDQRQILTIFLSYPSESEGSSEQRVDSFVQPQGRMYSLPSEFDLDYCINEEWGAEAGNMLITGR